MECSGGPEFSWKAPFERAFVVKRTGGFGLASRAGVSATRRRGSSVFLLVSTWLSAYAEVHESACVPVRQFTSQERLCSASRLAGAMVMNSGKIKISLSLTLLVGLVGLCGCVHEYLIKLSNGDQVISLSKPRSQGTNYFFTDTTGSASMVPRSRVVKIRAISFVEDGRKPAPPPSSEPPKKPKHWYLLWLG